MNYSLIVKLKRPAIRIFLDYFNFMDYNMPTFMAFSTSVHNLSIHRLSYKSSALTLVIFFFQPLNALAINSFSLLTKVSKVDFNSGIKKPAFERSVYLGK